MVVMREGVGCQCSLDPTIMPFCQLGSELIRHIYVACNSSVMGSVAACFNRCGGDVQDHHTCLNELKATLMLVLTPTDS